MAQEVRILAIEDEGSQSPFSERVWEEEKIKKRKHISRVWEVEKAIKKLVQWIKKKSKLYMTNSFMTHFWKVNQI